MTAGDPLRLRQDVHGRHGLPKERALVKAIGGVSVKVAFLHLDLPHRNAIAVQVR